MENFLPHRNHHPRTTIHHAIHHNFTTKTPHQTPAFPKTPIKNAQRTAKNTLSAPPEIFMK
jgi:hypothetical protein